MKRLTLILGIFAISLSMMAQKSVVNKYFEKYSDNNNFAKIIINQKMFSIFANFEGNNEEETEFMQTISRLEGMKIIINDSCENPAKLFKTVAAEIDEAGYEELMTVTDAEENVKFSIKEKDGIVEELIMLVGGNKKFVILSLFGDIDLKNISKIASGMKLNGMENLKNFHTEHQDDNDKK